MSTGALPVVGGAVMVAVPKRYTLAELVAQCDPSLPLSKEEQEWLAAPAVGLEVGAAMAGVTNREPTIG